MTPWGAQSIQFVWFVASVDGLDSETIFKALFEQDPDSVQRNRVPAPANPFLSSAEGQIQGYVYRILVQTGRLDVVCEPLHDPDTPMTISERPRLDYLQTFSQMTARFARTE